MRSATATNGQSAKVLGLRYRRNAARLWVKDSGGTYRNLSSLANLDWLDEADLNFDVDQPVADARIRLFRESFKYSLAPLMSASKFNQGTPQIDVGRGIKIETATVPRDSRYAIQTADWENVFEGYIDELDAGGGDVSTIELQCRDLGAALQERWLEKQGRTDGTAYGSLVGVAFETVMQQVLDDWGPGGITLYTPNGTDATPINAGDLAGWNITRFVPDTQCVLDALRILANQIGYEVRYRWTGAAAIAAGAAAKWRLEVFNPPRAKVVPDTTILANSWFSARRVGLSRASIRNVVVVSYQTDPDAPDTRLASTATDATSVAKYGRKWMQVTEAASSAINTSTEANKMSAAILADLKDPKVEQEVEVPYHWALELGDLATFKANGIHFDADQNLAVVGLRHRISKDQWRTTISCRGTPAGSYSNWGQVAGTAGVAPPVNTYGGPTLTAPGARAVVGGLEVEPPDTKVPEDLEHYEVHVSTTTGFTPDASTLKGKILGTKMQVLGLPVGQTHYAKLVPVRKSGVKGAATPQSSVAAGVVSASIAPSAGGSSDGSPYSFALDNNGSNLCNNPSFEVNVTDFWTADADVTLTRDTATFFWGVAAAKIVTGVAGGDRGIVSGNVAAVNGDKCVASAFIQNQYSPNASIKITIQFLTGALADNGSTTKTYSIGPFASPFLDVCQKWTRIYVNATAPPNTAFFRMKVQTPTNSTTVYVDGCQMEKNVSGGNQTIPSSYMDGSLGASYSWAGTAHNSVSSRVSGFNGVGSMDPNSPGYAVFWDKGGIFKLLGLEIGNDDVRIVSDIDGATNAMLWRAFSSDQAKDMPIGLVPQGNGAVLLGDTKSVANGGKARAFRGAGTAFPSSPQTNDEFFRTDFGVLYYYDGAAWVPISPSSKVLFHAWLNTNTNTSAAAFVLVPFDNEEYDVGGNYTTGASAKFTAPRAGYYSFSGSVLVQTALATDSTVVGCSLFKNGTRTKDGSFNEKPSSSQRFSNVVVAATMKLAASDTVDLRVYCQTAITGGIPAGQAFTYFCGHMLTE